MSSHTSQNDVGVGVGVAWAWRGRGVTCLMDGLSLEPFFNVVL